ncbi:MAG: helix-turn-helix domain-containing protein [Chloroflexi bacterium]|nr:helix-turn-helix domain-containing protein [Chloroflexota bacterium]
MTTSKYPEIMTVSEVAEYLRMGQSTIYKLLKEKRIPAFKIGGSWRFKRTALDKWIAQGSENAHDSK